MDILVWRGGEGEITGSLLSGQMMDAGWGCMGDGHPLQHIATKAAVSQSPDGMYIEGIPVQSNEDRVGGFEALSIITDTYVVSKRRIVHIWLSFSAH